MNKEIYIAMRNVLELAKERVDQFHTLSFTHAEDILADQSIKIVDNYLNEQQNIAIAKDDSTIYNQH